MTEAEGPANAARSIVPIVVMIVATTMLVPNAAHGQRSLYIPEYEPFYAGLTVGLSDFEDQYLRVGYGDTVWAAGASIGYRFDWVWSVEAAWQTFGDIEERGVLGSGTDRLDITTSLDAASLRLRLWFPMSELYNLRRQITLFGFAGVQASMLERSAVETTSSSSFREEETNYGLTVGGGLIYRLGKFNLRGSIDWVDINSVDDGRITSATFGIEFNF